METITSPACFGLGPCTVGYIHMYICTYISRNLNWPLVSVCADPALDWGMPCRTPPMRGFSTECKNECSQRATSTPKLQHRA